MIIEIVPAEEKMDEIKAWLKTCSAPKLTQVDPPQSSRDKRDTVLSKELEAIGFLTERGRYPHLIIKADHTEIEAETNDIPYDEYTDVVFAEDTAAVFDNAILLHICDLKGDTTEWCVRIITRHGIDKDRYKALRELGVEISQALITSVKEE